MSATSPAIPPSPPSMADVLKHRRPLRNVHREVLEHISALDRLALWITIHVGSMGFFLTIFGWTVCWLGWNVLAPPALQFDPPMAFVFWLFISNVIQILLMPLIMVGQNLQSRHGEARAENDLRGECQGREGDRGDPAPPRIPEHDADRHRYQKPRTSMHQ